MIDRRKTWQEIAQQRWVATGKSGVHTILAHRGRNVITDEVEQHLHDLAEMLISSGVDYKLVVSVDFGWLYTNDIELIDQLRQQKMLSNKIYTEAIVDRPKNTIRLKNPKHQHRSYFKLTKITEQQKINLVNFLTNQHEAVRCSPALVGWIKTPFHRTQDYFFVDHQDMTWLTMLALVHPGLIRKTLQIIAAK
jgi:hypothetical protein